MKVLLFRTLYNIKYFIRNVNTCLDINELWYNLEQKP